MRPVPLTALAFLFCCGSSNAAAGGQAAETYYYEAVPGGRIAAKEVSAVSFTYQGDKLFYVSLTTAPAGFEEMRAELYAPGRPGTLERVVRSALNKPVRHERIWREGDAAYLQDELSGGAPEAYKLPPGREFAVGDTVAALLRAFPFEQGGKWDIFVLDFTDRHVTVTARNAGSEVVRVPAGAFDCYKIELTVNIPILKPKIYCWLTKAPPHFLVKQRGKRGPFTPYYETVLTGRK